MSYNGHECTCVWPAPGEEEHDRFHPDWHDLGDHHAFYFTTLYGQEGNAGAIIRHQTPKGNWCEGGVRWRAYESEPHPPVWTLFSENPLHIEPSVLCLCCGDHGFIRDGKWQRV